MNNIQRPKSRKKEYCVKLKLMTQDEQDSIHNLLNNINNKTGLDNGENAKAALEMYYESLKAGKR